jgi:hypothetical protein
MLDSGGQSAWFVAGGYSPDPLVDDLLQVHLSPFSGRVMSGERELKEVADE